MPIGFQLRLDVADAVLYCMVKIAASEDTYQLLLAPLLLAAGLHHVVRIALLCRDLERLRQPSCEGRGDGDL